MLNYDLIEKNKNKIINFGVIILALVIAFQFHKSADHQVGSLLQQQASEIEKNKVVEDIAALEKKSNGYKKVFVKKDLASVMDTISGIAKDASVKIISVKPFVMNALDSYSSFSFLITLNAQSYHALGDFISKIENHKDIYLVSDVSINSKEANSNEVGVNPGLEINLKINTISYL